MIKPKNFQRADLFDQRTMSFGAHLEELRTTLIKASLWLALGTAIGFYFAADVIKYVSKPFQDELRSLQVRKITEAYRLVNHDEPPANLKAWMTNHGMVPEQVFVVSSGDELSIDTFAEGTLEDRMMQRLSTDPLTQLKQQIQMRPIALRLKSFELTESFMVYFKASLLVGAVISSPAVFWHLWSFLAAGLYPHERRGFYVFLPISLSLFIAGVCLAFFVTLRLVVSMLMATSDSLDVEFEPRLRDSMSFVLMVPLAFGIAFQLPVVMLALNRFGIVAIETYTQNWRVALLGVALASMVLTPTPDATNMLAMFLPLTMLYFAGIFLCRVMQRSA